MKRKTAKIPLMMEGIRWLRVLTEIIAFVLCLILIAASGVITFQGVLNIMNGAVDNAILDALFVVILLELFYVIRSFIKRGSMNVGVIINVGIIASVKELIFQLDSLDQEIAVSFGIIFITLGVLYVLEMLHYERKRTDDDED